MIWKTDNRLHGLHSAVVCFCSSDACSNFQIVWVSEYFEKPQQHEAVKQLYEIGWGCIEENNNSHWLCAECVKIYYVTHNTQPLHTSKLQSIARTNIVESSE